MLKKTLPLLLAVLLCLSAAAETYTGQTCAGETITVCAAADGASVPQDLHVGDRVEKGTTLSACRTTKVYAPTDGTVTLPDAQEGDSVHGSVLTLLPEGLYTVYCTVDGAYDAPENTLVHSGETVWMKCTADGSHRAIGCITAIEGDEYRVLTTGGVLYVGETADIYRSEDFEDESRIGIGTVLSTSSISMDADGVLTALHVTDGEFVLRGALLFETSPTDAAVTAPESGIITAVQSGSVQKGQMLLTMVPDYAVNIVFTIPEADAAAFETGTRLTLRIPDGDAFEGTVKSVTDGEEDGTLTVTVSPKDVRLPLGLHIDIET